MEEKIKKYLVDLEKEHGIEILLACETGSRAWGFQSPDSDYDVRIIYKHPTNWYLGLIEQKDTIEYFFENNDIDINGWDLRKSLRLLAKSNPSLLERIQSPIIYKVNTDFLSGINKVALKTYSRISSIHHYMSMAKNTFAELTGTSDYKLKKFFYALRTSVACLWILEKTEIPPIEFGKMLHGLNLPTQLTQRIEELIEIKYTKSETYLHNGEQDIFEFIQFCIERAEKESQQLPAAIGKISDLNDFFIQTLNNDHIGTKR